MDNDYLVEFLELHLDYVHAVERGIERRLTIDELFELVELANNNGMLEITEMNRKQQEMAATLGQLTEGFIKAHKKIVYTHCQCKYTLEDCILKVKSGLGTCCLYCEHESNVE